MGTKNFNYNNVLYKVDIDNEDVDYIYEDIVSQIRDELTEHDDFIEDADLNTSGELRSYPHRSFGFFEDYVHFDEDEIRIHVIVMVRSGYYSGMNFDYTIEYDEEPTEEQIKIMRPIIDSRIKLITDAYERFTEKVDI